MTPLGSKGERDPFMSSVVKILIKTFHLKLTDWNHFWCVTPINDHFHRSESECEPNKLTKMF